MNGRTVVMMVAARVLGNAMDVKCERLRLQHAHRHDGNRSQEATHTASVWDRHAVVNEGLTPFDDGYDEDE